MPKLVAAEEKGDEERYLTCTISTASHFLFSPLLFFFFLLLLLLFGGVNSEKTCLPAQYHTPQKCFLTSPRRDGAADSSPEPLRTRLRPPLTAGTIWVAVHLPVLP